jgi:hypothetical protein
MKRWGLRALSLSAVAKADAELNVSCNHLIPNVLYIILPIIFIYFLSLQLSVHVIQEFYF